MRRSRPLPVTDTVKRAQERLVRRDARRARSCGRCRRRRYSAARLWNGPDGAGRGARAGDRRRVADRARRRHGGDRAAPAGEPQGHHAARPASWRRCCSPSAGLIESRGMLTDYHLHLRPDDRERARRASTSRVANAERYRAVADEQGIAELGVSEHVYRFQQALDGLAASLLARIRRATTSTSTARSCASRPTCGSASRPTSCPGAEDRTANLLDGARLRLRRRLGALHRASRRVDMDEYGDLGRRDAAPRRSGGATSRCSARRRAAACSTSSPTPIS